MRFFILKDKGADIEQWKRNTLKKNPKAVFLEYELDFGRVPWEPYGGGGKLKVAESWVQARCQMVKDDHGLKVDTVKLFVNEENWQNGTKALWGIHYGKTFSGYEVTLTKMRKDYFKTAEHEDMHIYDDMVYRELGIRLETILGVPDYDKYVVHGEGERYNEYEYGNVMKKMLPYVQGAVRKRRERFFGEGFTYRELLEKAKRLAREVISNMRARIQSYESDLTKVAEAVKQFEGWKPDSRSMKNNNPGNLRYSPLQSGMQAGYSYFSSYERGWQALLRQLRLYITGKSKHTTGNETIREMVDIWAPPHDNNAHNENYARAIADALGVGTDYRIGNINIT